MTQHAFQLKGAMNKMLKILPIDECGPDEIIALTRIMVDLGKSQI